MSSVVPGSLRQLPAQGRALEADRALLGRISTAERVAEVLRTRIAEGFFPPGSRLAEDTIGSGLGVSRNTLREAFQLLTRERLLTHELNRGVFVRVLTVSDVIDLYRVRKLVECAIVRDIDSPLAEMERVAAAVVEGEQAEKRLDWQGLGTANIHFHQALAALAGSPRVDELMRGILAELRLVFHVMADPRRFYEPYLAGNREILGRIEVGDGPGAERLLAAYLDTAQEQLVDAYAQRSAADG
ncbi:MAG: GntR family transcriptional regulator [Actinomycetota bacterium]|nr:GntR family transcriptional regulator [Actinomycetota bacterium]